VSTTEGILLNWLLLFPFFAAAVIAVFPRIARLLPASERQAAAAAPAATAVTAITLSLGAGIAAALIASRTGAYAYADYRWTPDSFQFRLRLDPLGLYSLLAIFAGLIVTAVWAAAAGMRDHTRWAAFAASAGAFTGIVLAADVVLLYVFWEASALTVWAALTPTHASGRRYLVWSHAGGLCILAAVLWAAALTGETHIYSAGPGLLIQRLSLIRWLALALTAGLAVKLALAPAHLWLLDLSRTARGGLGMALLGVSLVAAGCAAIRLLFYLLPTYAAAAVAWLPILLGGITAAYAGLRAVLADDIQAGAAYLLAAAMGQITLGIGVAMRGGMGGPGGALALLAPLALGAPLLAAGAASGARPLRQAQGRLYRPREGDFATSIGSRAQGARGKFRSAPAAGVALIAGACTLAGVPALAGFAGQRALVTASWHVSWALGTAALIAPALMLAYALKAAVVGFAGGPSASAGEVGADRCPPAWWWVVGVVLASVALGVTGGAWAHQVFEIARSLTGG